MTKNMSQMIVGINHITLAVTDVAASFVFYSEVLGLKPLVQWDKGAYFLVDNFWFCLNEDKIRKVHDDTTHYAFTVSEDTFQQTAQRLLDSGVKVYKENTSPGASLYFLDPDAHKLEIHSGNWQSRLEEKKHHPGNWNNITWY
ncbi:MAG: VOC family protein [Gammaproteobacteria bacterium]|nr:VOC family protein [Gammaproteobacteria bacterium]